MKTKIRFLIVSFSIILICTQSCLALSYHVAKTGNDNNAGSQSSPYLTISKAAQILQPGDSVIVHTGEYREWVQPARGGTSETARITYKAAPGETVVVKGSERITTWTKQDSVIWKVELPDSYFAQFGDWRPFRDTIVGRYTGSNQGSEWLSGGSWCHLGDVYVDGQIYLEKQTQALMQSSPRTWYTSRSGTTQTIYANFGAVDPNVRLTEINVRQAVFGKDVQTGINYITVDGFSMSQSAEEWLPTYASPNSRGTIFTSGGNWIIQNCTVTLAKMRGIVTKGGTNYIVRNNVVENCGSAGIGGANADGSIICGNWIRNIHGARAYYGYEHGGIKYHTTKNMVISGNIISNVRAQNCGNGIWLDWPTGNNRITGNIITDVTLNALVFENPSGPHLVDNNIIANGRMELEDGNLFVNNIIGIGPITIAAGYWGKTHAVSNKFFNNIMAYTLGGWMPNNTNNNSDYNAFVNNATKTTFDDVHSIVDAGTSIALKFVYDTVAKSVTISFTVSDQVAALKGPIVSTSTLGQITAGSSTKTMTNPDGSSLTIDKDFFQNCRTSPTTTIGPFNQLKSGVNTFTVHPTSDFNYKNPCIPVGVINTPRIKQQHSNRNLSSLLFNMQGQAIRTIPAFNSATLVLPMGAYIVWTESGNRFQCLIVAK